MSNVKKRPIILNAKEVNAVLAGNKTQHIVILSSQPYTNKHGFQVLTIDGVGISELNTNHRPFDEAVKRILPRTTAAPYRIGDCLWVQEPTLAIEDVGWIGPVFVASDDGRNAIDWGYGPYDDPAHIPACELTYNNPCDLSYEDSRILLKVTDIRTKRVQDITLGESLKEARDGLMDFATDYWMAKHGEAAWFTNPWVWVIDFKVIKGS